MAGRNLEAVDEDEVPLIVIVGAPEGENETVCVAAAAIVGGAGVCVAWSVVH